MTGQNGIFWAVIIDKKTHNFAKKKILHKIVLFFQLYLYTMEREREREEEEDRDNIQKFLSFLPSFPPLPLWCSSIRSGRKLRFPTFTIVALPNRQQRSTLDKLPPELRAWQKFCLKLSTDWACELVLNVQWCFVHALYSNFFIPPLVVG